MEILAHQITPRGIWQSHIIWSTKEIQECYATFGLFDVIQCLTVSDCIVFKIYDSASHLSVVEQLRTIMEQ